MPGCSKRPETIVRMEIFFVTAASLLAGFVDAIVGGGGLVLVPALFAAFPSTHPATLFGVNKGASICGTAVASVQYARRVDLRWTALLPAAVTGFAGSMAGAWLVTEISPQFLRRLLPLVLLGVLIYTLAKKELGHHHAPRFTGLAETLAACCIGLVIGFYDGFFGPGTGAFWILGLVTLLGQELTRANAFTKVVNLASNLGSLLVFAVHGQVAPWVALAMIAGQLIGARLGSGLVLRHGAGLIRGVFIVVVLALVLRLLWPA